MLNPHRSRHHIWPRVFVAMPFGKKEVERNADREKLKINFDDVWKLLIRPALLSAECRPYRADEEMRAGDIRTDMFFELVTGEFVLADISTLNVNVFYELGVRHGVSPRGVLMVDGGWDRRPFDVAPDRTFSYMGKLFEPDKVHDETWQNNLSHEVNKLAKQLQSAVATDASTTSSPVYKELHGLKPVDWSQIQNSKARYFGGQLHDWHARVRRAKRQSHVGDILTLARDAPNRLIEWRLRLEAARALFDLHRLEPAHELLSAMVNENPECPETRYILAKTLDGLAEKEESREKKLEYHVLVETEIEEALHRGGNDPEAHRLMGRIYKYRWRQCWEHARDVDACQQLAARHWKTAEKALAHYQEAQTRDLNLIHAGVNVIALGRLRAHLKLHEPDQLELDADLVGLIKTAARNTLERGLRATAGEKDKGEAIWANAVLGEVALLTAKPDEAKKYFHRAATDPDVSLAHLVSFKEQLRIYEKLGFEKDHVRELRQAIENQRDFQNSKQLGTNTYGVHAEPCTQYKVIAFRGESFYGKELEKIVFSELRGLVERLQVDTDTLVICGARRGSELLFAEECIEHGARLRILLPVKRSEFVSEAVRSSTSDWEKRFYKLVERCEVLEQNVRLGTAPTNFDPYQRNNVWCLEIARTEFGPNVKPHVIVCSVGVGDLDPINERGTLSHFQQYAQELNLPFETILVKNAGLEPTLYIPNAKAMVHVQRPNGKTVIEPFVMPLRVGRAEDNNIILKDRSISRYHLRLDPDDEGAQVTNLSRNPKATRIDGQALQPDSENTVLVTFKQTIELVDGTHIVFTREDSPKPTLRKH